MGTQQPRGWPDQISIDEVFRAIKIVGRVQQFEIVIMPNVHENPLSKLAAKLHNQPLWLCIDKMIMLHFYLMPYYYYYCIVLLPRESPGKMIKKEAKGRQQACRPDPLAHRCGQGRVCSATGDGFRGAGSSQTK